MRFFLGLFLSIVMMGTAGAAPLHLSNLQFPITISGIAVTLSADADLDIHTTPDQVMVDGNAIIDLSDLQKQALPLAQTIALPKDNKCNAASVNSIDAASITPSGDAAHIKLDGNITGYFCKKVLGVEVDGQKSSNMTAEADIVAQAAEDHVGLALRGNVDAHASNDLVKALMSVFGSAVTNSLSASVAHALDGTQISTSIPTLPDLVIHLSDVSFFGDGPTLKLRAKIAASIGPQGLTQLLVPGKKP